VHGEQVSEFGFCLRQGEYALLGICLSLQLLWRDWL